MKTKDIYTNIEYRYSLGTTEGGVFFISIPVSNSKVDYEEYYEIDKSIVDQYPNNIDEVKKLADSCRRQKMDKYLLELPGRDRGVASWPKNSDASIP